MADPTPDSGESAGQPVGGLLGTMNPEELQKLIAHKCHTRLGKGNRLCLGRSIPMERLDGIVIEALSEKVCAPARIKTMLGELQRKQNAGRSREGQEIRVLTRELDGLKLATERLYEAVEKGLLPSDSSLHERIRKLQARRQAILVELANLRQRGSLPLTALRPGYIHAFAHVLRKKLLTDKGLAKQYLRLLVTEVRLSGNTLRMTGSYAALAVAVAQSKTGTHGGVPSFDPKWLPDQGSNLGPAD